MAKSSREIADMIERLLEYYAAMSTTLILLNDDDILKLLEAKGYDRGSTIRLGRRNNSYYEGIDFWQSIHAVRGKSGFNLDFLGGLMMTILSWVGDELAKNQYFDKTPELEFFRHLRNGISHGNFFNLLNGEPRRPAAFKLFEINAKHHGQNVLFEFISTGDLFDLFDHVKSHLRTLPKH